MPELTADGPPPQDTPESWAADYAGVQPGFGEYASSIIGETSEMATHVLNVARYASGPLAMAARATMAAGAAEVGSSLEQIGMEPDLSPAPSPKLTKEEATKRHPDIAKLAPDLFTDGMPEAIVDERAKSKAEEIARNDVISRYESKNSWFTNFPTHMALTMLDPGNLVALLVPGIGEEVVLARLGASFGARMVARTVAGATAGAAGMAAISARHYGMAQVLGADYGLRDAFMDLASGAAFGALIHGGVGLGREYGVLRPDQLMAPRPRTNVEPPPEQTAEGVERPGGLGAGIMTPAGEGAPAIAPEPLPAEIDAGLVKRYIDAVPPDLMAASLARRDANGITPKLADAGQVYDQLTGELAEIRSRPSTATIMDTPERVALQNSIVGTLDRQAGFARPGEQVPRQAGKRVDLVLGPPAAGKSSYAVGPLLHEHGSILLDADEAKQLLPEFAGGAGAGAVHVESAKIAENLLARRALERGDNIVQPLVGKNLQKIQQLIKSYVGRGYQVNLHYVDLPIEKSMQRALTRYIETGRLLDPGYIASIDHLPRVTYDALKDSEDVTSHQAISTDVGYGQPAQVLERRGETQAYPGLGERGAGSGAGGISPAAAAEIQAVVNTSAATAYDATRAALAQIIDGRPVDVTPIFDAQGNRSGEIRAAAPTPAMVAQQQLDLYRTGFEPSMAPRELAAATEEIYGKSEPAGEPGIEPEPGAVAGIPRDASDSPAVALDVAARSETIRAAIAKIRAEAAAPGGAAPIGEGQGAVPAEASAAPAAGIPGEALARQPAQEIMPIVSEIPNGVASFTPADLGIDAERFQFKSNADEAGVTERLKGVKTWDPIKAGMVLVWVDKDGKPWIVDGHQRLALAKKIAAGDPAQQPQLLARTLNEDDGVSPSMARAVAAMKNIAEGTGTAVDAAKIIREHPELAGDLPPRSELVRQARGLVNLDTDAFRMVINDVVPPNYAAIVGRLVPADGKMQGALLSLLAKTDPANATQAEAIVRQGMAAGTHVETQGSLFGDREVTESLYLERAKVLDRALKQLRRDKQVFSTLVKESDIVEEAGNKLAKDINEKRSIADAQALQILQILANRAGPISDALNAAARSAKSEGSYAGPVRAFVGSIRKSAQGGDLARLANGIERGAEHVGNEGQGELVGSNAAGPASEPVEAAASAQAEQIIRRAVTPSTLGADGLPQTILPGTEPSARQAASAREAAGGLRTTAPQAAAGGLFAPRAEEQPSLFGSFEVKMPDLDRDLAEAEKATAALQLTPEDRADIALADHEIKLAGLTEAAYAQAAECLAGAV